MPLICIMRNSIFLYFLLATLLTSISAKAQVRKIDTSASYGGLSYRVSCSNKSETENVVNVSPKGFGTDVRDMSFLIRGRLRKIMVEDLNEDGLPDLVLCVYGGATGELGNIVTLATSGKNSLQPIMFPDIYKDQKVSQGYKGHDEFSVVINTLTQSFPVYKAGDTDTATGGTRVVMYKIEKVEDRSTFKILRSYMKQ
jgi:hypothetical protein